jgi:hypothetical protein
LVVDRDAGRAETEIFPLPSSMTDFFQSGVFWAYAERASRLAATGAVRKMKRTVMAPLRKTPVS